MKKNGLPLVFMIPLMAASILVVGAFSYKLYSDETASRTKASEITKETPKLKGTDVKPMSGFGTMKGPTPTPSPIPVPTLPAALIKPIDEMTATDLVGALSGTQDDGGTEVLNALQNDMNNL